VHEILTVGKSQQQQPTMTSVELVDFINSQRAPCEAELRHRDFTAKVPKVLGDEMCEKLRASLKDAYGRDQPGYIFQKREACLMAMSYSYDLQAKVFDRMTALEQQVSKPAFVLPDFTNPAIAARAWADEVEAKQAALVREHEAQKALSVTAPKAEALDRISFADGSVCITNAAKALQCQPKRLFAHLQANRWIYRRAGGSGGFIGYQDKIQQGLLDHKVTTVERSDGSTRMVEQVLVTPKGLTRLAAVAEFGASA